MEKINILLAEDHVLVRQAMSSLLINEAHFQLSGETGNGLEAVAMALQLKPDIVIMDINLTGLNGIDATEQISRLCPCTKVLLLSMHNQVPYVLAAIRKGAMGYVTKSSSTEEVFKALLTIYKGEKYICEEMKNLMDDEMFNHSQELNGLEILTKREKKIITYLKEGKSSQEIADILQISKKTVEVHRYHILKKMNFKNTPALVNFISKCYNSYW
ncbi:MAG: response regulator [Sphingobacteriales bacterium]